MAGDLSISVVICTRNRAALLEKAMASVVGQDFPGSDYEIIIVDNGSTDQTQQVVDGFRGRALLRYIAEDRIGLAIARNTGWRAANGRFVAFFDDDALACPGWLEAIKDAFEEASPQIGVVGGRVDPIWEADRPSWLADEIAVTLTIVDWGPDPKDITDIRHEWLVGANMAVPKAVLSEIGGFHPWLDRVGANLLSSGDVFLQKEVMRRGFSCRYVPNMAIRHIAPASRLHPRWFLRRFFWQGVSDAVMYLIENTPSPSERIYLAIRRLRGVVGSRRQLRALLFRTERPEVFRSKCFALIDIGFIFGVLGISGH